MLVPLPSFFSFPLHSLSQQSYSRSNLQVPLPHSFAQIKSPIHHPVTSGFLIIHYPSILPFPSFFLLLIRASLSFSNQASFFEIKIYSLLLSFLVLNMSAPKNQNKSQIKGKTWRWFRLFLRHLPLTTEEQPFPISVNYQSLLPGKISWVSLRNSHTHFILIFFTQQKRKNTFLSSHAWKHLNSFN